MRYYHYSQQSSYPIVFLVPTINANEIEKEYLVPVGMNKDNVLIIQPYFDPVKKKTPAADMKEAISTQLAPELDRVGAQYVFVADAEYFKQLAKCASADANLGYVKDSVYGNWKVIYIPNFRTVFYDPPKVRHKIKQALDAVVAHVDGTYENPGDGIIKHAYYPKTDEEIQDWLNKLIEMNCSLSGDIEAFSLKHHDAGIGTITLCWNQEEGIAFPIDYEPIEGATKAPYGRQVRNEKRRAMLKDFFLRMKHEVLWHQINYDVYVLVYQLFMNDLLDRTGQLHGMKTMLEKWHDTKLITYLATNSCAGNKLSLKEQAQEYAGNYAIEEIKDICKIPLDQLLQYNLVDGLSTWYVYNKYWDKMVADQQLDIYNNLFKPAIVDIIDMQLTGMPLNMERVLEVEQILETDQIKAVKSILANRYVQEFEYQMNLDWVEEKNNTLKKKRVTIADAKEQFNPNSGPQLQKLLYKQLKLPILALTDSKQPSTEGDVLKKLRNHTKDQLIIDLLNGLLDFAAVNKILTTYITAFKAAPQAPDGWHYLYGNFNLGGTVSGRLSGSNPNLQNIPANSKYAKLIKSCFQAPPGWLFCGLDFASLEDRISALTTKDPNKLKVYTDGYDGHCLRAYTYFKDQMPDIDPTSVDSINSIDGKYKKLRQDSKAPTFALTYQGTYITLMNNCGFSKEVAQGIEESYKQLYEVSINWVNAKLEQATKDGYVTVAFGLRVRTPLLHQVIRGSRSTPFAAEAEGRTAGNALGQSWGLLNTRASIEFMAGVRSSKHLLDIKPCAHIHDAQYMLVREDIDAILYCNEHLVKAVQWQDHPDIEHDQVKLGGEFSIFWPSWEKELIIPNNASKEEILAGIEEHCSKLATP